MSLTLSERVKEGIMQMLLKVFNDALLAFKPYKIHNCSSIRAGYAMPLYKGNFLYLAPLGIKNGPFSLLPIKTHQLYLIKE